MEQNEKLTAEINYIIVKVFRSFEKGDIDTLISLYTDESGLYIFGTGSDEKGSGKETIKFLVNRDVNETESRNVTIRDLHVAGSGDVAWAAFQWGSSVIKNGQNIDNHLGRFTMVLERQLGGWRIVQSHASLPDPHQPKGQSFPNL